MSNKSYGRANSIWVDYLKWSILYIDVYNIRKLWHTSDFVKLEQFILLYKY